tara:strand:- start:245 stop:766 length:522 start_codon:yes stop_codon:yes gene_type:complete
MAIYYGDGSNSSSGRVVQVVTNQYTNVVSVASNSGLLNTSIYATITPKDNSNKVLVILSLGRVSGPSDSVAARIRRTISGSHVNVGVHTGSGNWQPASFQNYGKGAINDDHADGQTFMWLDSPNTTSSTDYRLQLYGQDNGTVYVNRTQNSNNSDHPYSCRTASSIILQEIAA